MKKRIVKTCLWALVLAMPELVLAEVTVISGPHSYGGHTYSILSTSSWTDAEIKAVELGGHLVTINDEAENTFVVDTLLPLVDIGHALWIGLSDAAAEDTFVWSNGESFVYGSPPDGSPPWAGSEPGQEGDDYDYINIHKANHVNYPGKWNDWPDGGVDPTHGIVEVPEPATMAVLALGGLAVLRRRRKR